MRTPQLLLETGSLGLPGSDRGLGRYTRSFRDAYTINGSSKIVEITARSPLNIQRELERLDRSHRLAYHSTSAFGLPLIKNRPWVCSIQDIIPLDLSFYSTLGIRSRLAFRRAARSDIIVANSEYTASRISDKIRVPSSRIRTIALPVGADFSVMPTIPREERLDYFSSLVDLRSPDPRKRFHWLGPISTKMAALGVPLRVAGRGLEKLRQIAPDAIPVEAPTDAQLAEFYGRSLGFIYTSAYEGQGLPPIEAMATGTPVIAFRNTSVTEMVGEGQLLLDDPIPWFRQSLDDSLDSATLASILEHAETLSSNSAFWNILSRNALERSKSFDGNDFQVQVEELFQEVTKQ